MLTQECVLTKKKERNDEKWSETMKNGALNKRVLWLAASLLMMVAIALSATGEKEVEEGRLELVTAEAELGNERFNWILQTGTGVRVMISPYLETLLTLEEQAKPGLAERSEVSDDGLTRTFYLRRGAKFHNGDEVTADDVVFSVEHAMSEDAVYTIWRHSIEGVEAVDKYTAKIQFKIPMAGFPQRSTIEAPIFIVPKNYIEENGWDYFEDHPVGSGPYKVIDYSPGYSIKYEAWEEYWGDVPAFHYYTVLVVPEETTKVSMFRAGELDVIGASLPTALELAKEGFELQKTGAGRQATLQFMGTQLPEAQNLPIADPRVRRALGLAIDSQGIIDEYFMGRASVGRVHGAVPWLISEQDHEYWWKYAREKYYYDLEEAKRLLDEAGYGDGFHIDYFVAAAPAAFAAWQRDIVQIVAGYWEKIGVTTTIRSMDWGAFSAIRNIAEAPDSPLIGQPYIDAITRGLTRYRYMRAHFSGEVQMNNLLWHGERPGKYPELQAKIMELLSSDDDDLYQELIREFDQLDLLWPIVDVPDFVVIGPRVDVTVGLLDSNVSHFAHKAVPRVK